MMLRELIGRVLRQTRQAQRRTLREVADAVGMSIGHLSEVERGRKEPSSELLAAICRALGLTMADLLIAVLRDLAPQQPRLARFDLARLESAHADLARLKSTRGDLARFESAPQPRATRRMDFDLAA
ncbi:helix-turn-helix transcriptional regulator [Actinoplanes sp. LDG1-06]|uniref:Helix-turn-helix transcriptional regulator n=1 Tax=Paractinoplanes ovalisporus TaxID=2810368 RepID=A0ABS2AET4_9ACTN|nr:helix-turn-helix transcriptional regulator [Actinoplanes ovalisporus]